MNEDPIVVYIVVRETLGMSVGKSCAQVGHACQTLMMQYFDLKEEARKLHKLIIDYRITPGPTSVDKSRYTEISRKISIMGEWLNSSIRKIVLKADDKEWAKIKSEFPDCILIIDAGLTEIPSGSETVICLWPQYRSKSSKTIKRLQVL
jgi:peptidyl-tRNA hydrolase, PTH2 family